MNKEDRTRKILIIDDEPSTLNMLRLLLSTYGYTVLSAENGERGLEVFLAERPSIVLTDVRMPGMDGIEVLKKMKETGVNAEVIVVTGHGDMDTAVRSLQHDASDFINKPIQKQALEVALRRAEEKIELRRQLDDHTRNLQKKVEEATADLARSVRQLNTLFEISQSIGEMASLKEIIDLLRDRIQSITRLRCHALLILNIHGTGIVEADGGGNRVKITEDLVDLIRELREVRFLGHEETTKLLRPDPEAETEAESKAKLEPAPSAQDMALIPIARKGEPPVGAALAGVDRSGAEDELRLAVLLLSIAAGAIRRSVVQEEEMSTMRRMIDGQERFGDLIGRHARMAEIFKLVATVADSDATVLIQGESGTGKELIARRIHELSTRRKGPFVAINCAAFPQTLLESELFGHEKGAFTGAIHAHRGAFEQARGGTIFLDEIGEISVTAQVKMLRVIQFREVHRVGSEKALKVDVRILAATSRNLRKAIEDGDFREDLYYRLHVIPVMLPPLRERMSDLPPLADHFLRKLREGSRKAVSSIDTAAMAILMNHDWPGNIRELENVMEHAFVLASTDTVSTRDLPAYLRESREKSEGSTKGPGEMEGQNGLEGLDDMEKEHLIRILDQCGGNKIQAANKLKISRSTLYRKLQQYQIPD
jgi:two-component system response regulator HydG